MPKRLLATTITIALAIAMLSSMSIVSANLIPTDYNLSSTPSVSFTIARNPTPTPLGFNYWSSPIFLIVIVGLAVIVAVAIVSLVYFKRRKGKP